MADVFYLAMRFQWIVLACVLSLACLAQQRGRGGRRVRFDAAEAREGRDIYNRSCTMCHGLDGAAGDRAPALGAQRRYLRATTEELHDAIKNGIKGTNMPASPAMAEGDIRKVTAFIHSLRATAVDLDVPGDAAAGQALFQGKAGCAKCHMVNGQGGILGPDLSNLGAERSLAAIRESLTIAKPTPPRGFQPVTVTTVAGKRIEGLMKNQHNTSFQILGLDEKLYLLTAGEVREMSYGKTSLMPTGVEKRMNEAEFQNLLAYLSRLARSRR